MGNNSGNVGGSSFYGPGPVVDENTRLSDDDEINDVAHTLASIIREDYYVGQPFSVGEMVESINNEIDFMDVADPNVGLSGDFPDQENKDKYREYMTDEELVYASLEALADKGVLTRINENSEDFMTGDDYMLNSEPKDIKLDPTPQDNPYMQRTIDRNYDPFADFEYEPY